MEKQDFIYRVKMDNQVIDDMLESDNKRALSMYVLFLRMTKTAPFTTTTIGEMLKFFKLSRGTNQISSLKSQIRILQLNGLIEVYDSMGLDCAMDIESAKWNSVMYVTTSESISTEEFTLVDFDDIDKALFRCAENVETVISTALFICRCTERRKDIRPIMWFSIESFAKELHISKKSFMDISATMMEDNIIYFKKADIKKGNKASSHNIYSLYCDRIHVDNAVDIIKSNGVLDRSVKRIHGVQNLADYTIGNKDVLSKLKAIGYEINSEGAIGHIKDYLNSHSESSLLFLLNSIKFPAQVKNKTGYIINSLKESSYDNNRYDKIAISKEKTDKDVEKMDVQVKEFEYVSNGENGKLTTVGQVIEETTGSGNIDIDDDVLALFNSLK